MTLTFINRRALAMALVLGLAFAVVSNFRAGAQNNRLPKRTGHINDFAEVLDDATRQRLEGVLEGLKRKTEVDFAIVTIKTASGEDLYDYSLNAAVQWNVGGPATTNRSLLLVIAADNSKFFTQISRSARSYLPEGVVGDMGQRLRESLDKTGFSNGLLTGLRAFVNTVGDQHNFTFASLDPKGEGEVAVVQQQRPRTVQPQAPQETPTVAPVESPAPTPAETTPPVVTPSPVSVESASPVPSESPTVVPRASESPAAAPPTPEPSAVPTESPKAVDTPAPAASSNPFPDSTPAPAPTQLAANTTRPSRPTANPKNTNSATARNPNSTAPPNPDDEKEEVELTLTLPAEKRIDVLKAFIAAHPTSVAVPRANELIVVAHAMVGDQKIAAGDVDAGIKQFRLAFTDAPGDIPDRLFSEVLARIPLNLFLRDQRDAAYEMARQAETLAQGNARRLVAVVEFYLAVENPFEAGRIAEAAVQLAPDSAQAHQALGAAYRIALRLDDAEKEYNRALTLDAKSSAARLALADLKRAGGKSEESLALYREHLQTDAKSKPARAGMILSLLDLGRKQEAETELAAVLQDQEQARNIPLLVGASYWFVAHNDSARALDLAARALAIEPRYSWAQIANARALVAERQPLAAERAIRFARQFGRFPTLDYELASVLAGLGLYDEAAKELRQSFSLNNGEIETKLAGRVTAHASSFMELLAPERRAAIFQTKAADSAANDQMLKALLAFDATWQRTAAPGEDELMAVAQDFVKGNDPMRTYRMVYVASKFVKKGVAYASVIDLMDRATAGVEVALSVPAATVAVQPEELSDMRARALTQGGTPNVPDAPRSALSGILRGRIEDLAGVAFFNLDKPAEAVTHLRRAITSATEGTPLWRAALWHLGAALEANGKADQALLYYIKSYVSGPPDPARRSIIESVYKKVNGTLEGLDDKIGPGVSAASGTPTPKP
jgi:tetratricopeptide (TPR) repeat protein